MTEEIRWNERKETAGSVITCDKAVLKSFPWKTHMVWFKSPGKDKGRSITHMNYGSKLQINIAESIYPHF